MRATLWGPAVWRLMFACTWRLAPENVARVRRLLIEVLPDLLPCPTCQEHYRGALARVNRRAHGHPREGDHAFRWCWYMKDEVNRRLQRQSIHLSDLVDRYLLHGNVIAEVETADVLVLGLPPARATGTTSSSSCAITWSPSCHCRPTPSCGTICPRGASRDTDHPPSGATTREGHGLQRINLESTARRCVVTFADSENIIRAWIVEKMRQLIAIGSLGLSYLAARLLARARPQLHAVLAQYTQAVLWNAELIYDLSHLLEDEELHAIMFDVEQLRLHRTDDNRRSSVWTQTDISRLSSRIESFAPVLDDGEDEGTDACGGRSAQRALTPGDDPAQSHARHPGVGGSQTAVKARVALRGIATRTPRTQQRGVGSTTSAPDGVGVARNRVLGEKLRSTSG